MNHGRTQRISNIPTEAFDFTRAVFIIVRSKGITVPWQFIVGTDISSTIFVIVVTITCTTFCGYRERHTLIIRGRLSWWWIGHCHCGH